MLSRLLIILVTPVIFACPSKKEVALQSEKNIALDSLKPHGEVIYDGTLNDASTYDHASKKYDKKPVYTVKRELTDTFIDSVDFGLKGKSKIILEQYENKYYDETGEYVKSPQGVSWPLKVVHTKLFSLKDHKWQLKADITLEKHDILGLKAKLYDYNADGYLDISYNTQMAGRGSNTGYYVILYAPANDSLVWVRNSDNYPNLIYNPELKCLDAMSFTNCASQEFLKLEGDSLVEIGSLTRNEKVLNVSLMNATTGKLEEFEIKANKDNGYIRYLNFKPLKVHPDFK